MTAARVRAFDWLRGIAVVVMIQTHALVLLRPELRRGDLFVTLQWIDGLVAPSFILAAGFSMALTQVRAALGAGDTSGARARRLRRTLRRIFEVLLVATLVNWMWFPIFREPRWILRIDILQCIGLALLIALPFLFTLATRPQILRIVALLLAAIAFGISPLAEHVGPPLATFVNGTTGAVFPLVPWSGYVYLGAAIGTSAAIDGPRGTALSLVGLAAAGALLWVLTPQVAALYPPHEFWVTDPANHARRWTQVALFALLLLGFERLQPRASLPLRFIEVFGTSSLAGYFLHQMLLFFRIHGFCFEAVWGSRLAWAGYWPILALLIAATFGLTVLVDAVYRRVDAKLR